MERGTWENGIQRSREKKIDFRKILVEDVTGKNSTLDISKELGNAIYKNTPDLGELDFAQELYKKGEYSIDEFADPLNKRGYTLAELKALDEKTFNNVLGEK